MTETEHVGCYLAVISPRKDDCYPTSLDRGQSKGQLPTRSENWTTLVSGTAY